MVQYYCNTKIVRRVAPSCFIPRPKVDSIVIRLDQLSEPRVNVKDEKLMFELIRASFQVRRKTLWNGIKISNSLNYTREEIEKVLTDMGLDVNVRGETLNLVQFAELADRIDEL